MDDSSVLCYDPPDRRQNPVYYSSSASGVDESPTPTPVAVQERPAVAHDLSEMSVMKDISNVGRRIKQLETALLNRYDCESPVRQFIERELSALKQRLTSLMDCFHFQPSPSSPTLPAAASPSDTVTIQIAVPTSSLPLSEVSGMVSSLSQSLLQIELQFLDCQGDFSAFPSGSWPLAERVENLEGRLSLLSASSSAIQMRMENVKQEFAPTLSDKAYVLSQVSQPDVSVASVVEKVSAAEPVVTALPKLKEELSGYGELLVQSGLLRERVRQMEARQGELERLLDETGILVEQVRSSMKEEIPQIMQLLDQLR